MNLENLKLGQVKLVALDMDGTVLNSNHILSQRTIEAINSLYDEEIIILFATGRMPSAVIEHFDKLKIKNEIIVSNNGALTLNLKKNSVINERYLNKKILKFANEYSIKNEIVMNINTKNHIYSLFKNKLSQRYSEELGIDIEKVNGECLLDIENELVSLLLLGNIHELKIFLEILKENFKEKFSYELLPWFDNNYMLQILDENISKGFGVIEVAKKFKIKAEQIMSFGDSFNDLYMIKTAGIGIAMGNACEELKKIADYTTKSNDENGVAIVLEKLKEVLDNATI